jgi:hypothetical protein
MPARRPYDTDLSGDEWQIIEALVPNAKPGAPTELSKHASF